MAPASLAAQPTRWAKSPLPSGQPRFQIPLEAEQQLARLGVEGQQSPGRRRCRARPEWSGWRPGLAAPGRSGRPPPPGRVGRRPAVGRPDWPGGCRETGPAGRGRRILAGRQGRAEPPAGRPARWSDTAARRTRGSAAAVDLEQIPSVALEVHPEVGAGGLVVAAGHLVEDVAFRAQEGDAAVGGQQPGQSLRGGVSTSHRGTGGTTSLEASAARAMASACLASDWSGGALLAAASA
jgi:hypothetical protein